MGRNFIDNKIILCYSIESVLNKGGEMSEWFKELLLKSSDS